MAEWSNAAVSKTVIRGNADREFKSLPLRFLILPGKIMVRFFFLMCFVMLPTLGMAIEVDREALKDYTTALVIYNRTTGEIFNSDRS